MESNPTPTTEELTALQNIEELTARIEELTARIEALQNAEASQQQQLKAQSEQLQQRLQATGNATVSTRGQIAELEKHLTDQERDKHRLEGALDILQAMIR